MELLNRSFEAVGLPSTSVKHCTDSIGASLLELWEQGQGKRVCRHSHRRRVASLGRKCRAALAALKEAATLPVRCPYWYAAMVQVARQQGWSQARTRTLVDESVSFAPDFYHVYRYYADYLQPKWYGNEGDAEAFADGISRRIGGEEGAFVYFEIATLLNCGPCGSYDSVQLSWPKIKQGYAAQHLYGTSNLKMNRFALMATKVGDKSAAKETFAAIGERWDEEVWRSKQTFEAARTWAMN